MQGHTTITSMTSLTDQHQSKNESLIVYAHESETIKAPNSMMK